LKAFLTIEPIVSADTVSVVAVFLGAIVVFGVCFTDVEAGVGAGVGAGVVTGSGIGAGAGFVFGAPGWLLPIRAHVLCCENDQRNI